VKRIAGVAAVDPHEDGGLRGLWVIDGKVVAPLVRDAVEVIRHRHGRVSER
jgi:hypothetical protein